MANTYNTMSSDPQPQDNGDSALKRMTLFLLMASSIGLAHEIHNHNHVAAHRAGAESPQNAITHMYEETKAFCNSAADTISKRFTKPTEEPLTP